MAWFRAKDGAALYFKDWGAGPPVVFSHGWPLNSDSWEGQMSFLASHGYRCVAHDRRGHGRSGSGVRVPGVAFRIGRANKTIRPTCWATDWAQLTSLLDMMSHTSQPSAASAFLG